MDYLSFLTADPQVYEEIKQKKNIDFKFKQKERISNYVCRLSSKMHDIALPEVLNSSVLFEKFN